MFNLDGKVALVTGGGSGLGASIALALSRSGAKVALAARRKDKLRETEDLIKTSGGVAESYDLDVSNENDVKSCLNSIISSMGEIDILVNNAGTTTVGSIDGTTSDEWDLVINTNLRGPWFLAKEWVAGRRKKNIRSLLWHRKY